MNKKALRFLPLVLLSACATQLPPPESPTTTQIAATAAELAAANVSPSDYAAIGLTLAQRSCADWFSSQVLETQNARFAGQGLTMLGGIAAAAGGPAGAGAAAGAATIANLLGAYQSASLAGAAPASVYGLVWRIQQAWLAAMPAPLTVADAYALVDAFAQQCGLAAIQNAVTQAVIAVPVSAAPPPPPVSPAIVPISLPTQIQPKTKRRRGSSAPSAPNTISSKHLQQEWEESGRPFTGRLPQVCIGRC